MTLEVRLSYQTESLYFLVYIFFCSEYHGRKETTSSHAKDYYSHIFTSCQKNAQTFFLAS